MLFKHNPGRGDMTVKTEPKQHQTPVGVTFLTQLSIHENAP